MKIFERFIDFKTAKKLKYDTTLPIDNPIFMDAVNNSPDVQITEHGLVIDAIRGQKKEQIGKKSVRTGVFYLPKSSKYISFYKGKYNYGGGNVFEGKIVIKNPIFVKGQTGGIAPENAYKKIKNISQLDFETSLQNLIFRPNREEIKKFLIQYANVSKKVADEDAWYIYINSKEGNQLRYALQEYVIAHVVRDAGYDCVLGYSKGKNGYFISEIFDVRELNYPSHTEKPKIHKKFR